MTDGSMSGAFPIGATHEHALRQGKLMKRGMQHRLFRSPRESSYAAESWRGFRSCWVLLILLCEVAVSSSWPSSRGSSGAASREWSSFISGAAGLTGDTVLLILHSSLVVLPLPD